jgi:hypothetical protein
LQGIVVSSSYPIGVAAVVMLRCTWE